LNEQRYEIEYLKPRQRASMFLHMTRSQLSMRGDLNRQYAEFAAASPTLRPVSFDGLDESKLVDALAEHELFTLHLSGNPH
jgi:hypothetical protein